LAGVNLRSYPVIEIFGPTVQGEGRMVGAACHFVRFGGCDFRCSWCDTPFAVLPDQVRANSVSTTAPQIVNALRALGGAPSWIILSGGNPALLDLTNLIDLLHENNYRVALETQGSKWKAWFNKLDLLTLSPKPPSSGMSTDWDILDYTVATQQGDVDIKIVAFDDKDLEYAKYVFSRYPQDPHSIRRHFISTGTLVGISTRDDILDRMEAFIRTGLEDEILGKVTYGMQLHVLLFGHRRGV
jgi:7-carboxy-7-deazaguanine synthase